MNRFKVTAIPFLVGSWGYYFLADGDAGFSFGMTLLMLILLTTKQVKLI